MDCPDLNAAKKLMVSACLLGERCKYNGGDNFSAALAEYLEGREVVPVCPELAGGLSVPRRPCEIVDGVVTNDRGENLDRVFRAGAAACLQRALTERIDLAILQSRSPSCGVREVYDGSFSGKLREGEGVFAALLRENGFRTLDVTEAPAFVENVL